MSQLAGFESRKRRSLRAQQPNPLTCPRCESTNTKFCYYNNYNKTQPRYFCKGCKRHWTNGGILRNVPVGGGRKNKRLRRPVMSATATIEDQDSLLPKDDQSYTDIEELKGLVSCDFDHANPDSIIPISFINTLEYDDDSTTATSMIMSSSELTSDLSWNDLDAMVLEELITPWEDPTFET